MDKPNSKPSPLFGICLLSAVPVRAAASDKSEMTTQLLFGETFAILQQTSQWLYIQINHDQYKGWLDKKQATIISEQQQQSLRDAPKNYALSLLHITKQQDQPLPLLIGSTLPNFKDNQFKINDLHFTYSGNTSSPNPNIDPHTLIQYATQYLDAPYLWGGRTPFGIDCSGFTQIIYKIAHISLQRDASQQATQGLLIPSIAESKVGDLAFFGKTKTGKITHVGLLLDSKRIIHASGKVRIDALDETGIFDADQQQYTHQFHFIKRILG